jgi:hypothetical protein
VAISAISSQVDHLIERLTTVMLKAQNKSVPLVKREHYFIDITPDIKSDIKCNE